MRTRRTTIAALTIAIAATGALAGARAVAQDEAGTSSSMSLPEPFTARLACGTSAGGEQGTVAELPDDPGTTAFIDPLKIWRFAPLQVSDPRMGGQTYGYLSGTEWSNESWENDIGVYSALWHVVNDDGEWVGPYTTLTTQESGWATNSIRLEGRGGYEGLYAVIQADFRDDCGWDVSGYILEQDLPGFPAPDDSRSQ